MAGNNNFQSLREFSQKVYKFQQEKSIFALDPHGEVNGGAINHVVLPSDQFNLIKGGVCASLTCAWLKEKQTSGNSFRGNSAGGNIHTGKNLDTVAAAATYQIEYVSNFQKNSPIKLYGLKPLSYPDGNDVLVTKMTPFQRTTMSGYVERGFLREIEVLPSILNACEREYLKMGRGVYVSFTLRSTIEGKQGGGHAVGAYRSRGDKLYFFDSNCGVYHVADPYSFFDAWINCYKNIGYEVTINENNGNGFTYVKG
ncbi:hypothetical protein ACONUD_13240 [Microbulbifer harenosus]|uniref:Peptidase C58 YopT-type domain-containing protein n=1 Tax=Microbulbifer harenosus TaxID=2576840 RepID=A0ABY2UMK8_9GAMM|nr:hypothetical protein [Microbulbifer harenosus]TLM79373.1 hypothetical protein FDY93_04570 [Microbulbifer harenosus]